VADLGTIAFGTFVSASSTNTALNAPTGEPVLQVIASASDTSDVHDIANTTHVGVAFFELGNVPSDLGNMDTLSVQVRYGLQSGTRVNTWDTLTVQIVQSDLATALTDERTVASNIVTLGTTSAVLAFTGLNTTADRTVWDGAVAVFRFTVTKNMGGDILEERVFAAELTGEYTVEVAGPVEGQAEGVYAYTGTAAATVTVEGSAVGAYAYAGTAAGSASGGGGGTPIVTEDWSGYPDSTMGNPTALDGERHWRQGANQTVDLSKAGWRIRDGVAYAGAGFTTAAGIPTDEVSATASSISSARCETDLGTTDMYVRATFGDLIGSPAGTGFGVFARVGEADSLTCYYLQVRRANNEVRLFPVVAGSFGTQIGSSASHVYASGDVFELRCFGTTISVRVNDTEVISATNSTVTSGSKAGLFANTVASGSGVRCTAWKAGPLDGSGDPVETPVDDPIPMVLWATQVMAGATTARVSCQVRNAALVRIVVADNSGLTTPVFTSSYQAPSSLELTSFEATGLTAGTDYFYGLQVDDVTVGGVRELRTAPSGQASFTMAMSGDAGNIVTTNTYPLSIKTSNSPTYDRIADRDPAFFLFAGDRHYRDYNLDNVSAHLLALRDTFNNPRLAGLSEQLPVMQIWDDHDYTGVSDGSATGRDAAVELFRTAVPTDAWLVDTAITDPIGYTFTWGRTRWIILDHRSSRATNDILGSAQLAALLDLLENATEELIFLYVGVPWIAGSAPLADHWGAFTGNRATIAETIEDFAKGRVVILHADAHMLAIDDGTNTQYDTGTADPGPPLLCAAPVDSSTSFKTGTYSEGFVPDPVGPVHQQYATIEVDDQGSQLVVTMRGYQLSGTTGETEVISHQFTVSVGGDGPTASGDYDYTGTATGQVTVSGAASGSYGYAGTAAGTSGAATVQGAAAGTYGYSGTAAGAATVTGAASGSHTYAGTGAGTAEPSTAEGSASGSYTYAGTAAGSGAAGPVDGQAAGTYTYAGTAAGQVTVVGIATGAYAYAGSADGTASVFGAAAGGYVYAGSALGSGEVPPFAYISITVGPMRDPLELAEMRDPLAAAEIDPAQPVTVGELRDTAPVLGVLRDAAPTIGVLREPISVDEMRDPISVDELRE
jgi:phosphodiesterase/alkaline phosphatase D-like protein